MTPEERARAIFVSSGWFWICCYDERTRLLITGGSTPEDVGRDAAVAALRGLLAEFDFQSAGDNARAIASLIAPALKIGSYIPGRVPADVAEADRCGSWLCLWVASVSLGLTRSRAA